MPTVAEIKAKLQELQNQTKKQRDIWKPKDKHIIRLLPYPHGDKEPFLVLGFHYEIGKQTILCPKFNFGDDCAICDFADKLRSWKGEDGEDKPEALRKQEWELFKKIQVKERYMAPMFERGQEAEGAKFFAFSKTIYESFLSFLVDDESREMVNAGDDGFAVLVSERMAFDVKVDFKQANNKDNKGNAKPFGITEVETVKRPSKMHEDKATAKKLMDGVKSVLDIYPRVTSLDVERMFDKWLNSAAPEADGKTGDTGIEIAPTNSGEKPIENGRSIEDAFDDLVADGQ